MKTLRMLFLGLLLLVLGMNFSYAQCTGTGCKDYNGGGLSAADRLDLAKKFAPQLRFDNGTNTYPRPADQIFANSGNNTTCNTTDRLSQSFADDEYASDTWTEGKKHITTYYVVQNAGDRYFIDYWWAYYRQGNCIGSTGGHDFDWEHITVQVRKSGTSYQKVSVTFFQHGGWYTRKFATSSIQMSGDHPISYVGKIAHGNYHKGADCALIQCCYYGDCRNTSAERFFNAWEGNKLFEMTCTQTWAAWPGEWGNTGQGPLYKIKSKFSTGYKDATACKGDATSCGSGDSQQGCEYSDFAKTTKIGAITFDGGLASRVESLNETSAKDLPSQSSIHIYPSPAKDVVMLDGINPETSIQVINELGSVVMRVIGQTEINVSKLSKGVYVVKVGEEKVLRFVKE